MEPPLNSGFPCVYLAGYVERVLEQATSPGQSKSLVPGLGRTVPNVPCSWGSLESHPGQDSLLSGSTEHTMSRRQRHYIQARPG